MHDSALGNALSAAAVGFRALESPGQGFLGLREFTAHGLGSKMF